MGGGERQRTPFEEVPELILYMWNACASQPYNSDPEIKKMRSQASSWKSSGDDEDEHATWTAGEEEESNPSIKGTWELFYFNLILSSILSWILVRPVRKMRANTSGCPSILVTFCRGRVIAMG